MLGVDRSEGAMRAVRYVANVFREHLPELLLLHLTTELEGADLLSPSAYEGDLLHLVKEQLEQVQQDMKSYLKTYIDTLVNQGAVREHIRTRIVPGVHSHAALYSVKR